MYGYASPSPLSLPVTLSYRTQIESLIAARFPGKMMVSSADPSISSMDGKSRYEERLAGFRIEPDAY
jgi:hypothetical protein